MILEPVIRQLTGPLTASLSDEMISWRFHLAQGFPMTICGTRPPLTTWNRIDSVEGFFSRTKA